MTRIILLFSLLLALPAWATDWNVNPDSAGAVSNAIREGAARRVYYDFSDTTDPKVLAVSCRSATYWLNPDEDGASTGVLVQPYRCSEGTLSTNHCTPIYNDTDGDGIPNVLPLDGVTVLRIGREDVRVTYLAFDVTANPGSDDARITVECH